MKICLPVDQLNGLASEVFPNFRGAPALLVVDTETSGCQGIDSTSGACGAMPQHIDAIICAGGMGRGMFNGLRQRGVSVFNTGAITVAEALADLAAGRLEEVVEVASCGDGSHQDHEGGHAHGECGCGSHGEHGHGEHAGCGCGH
ncbi:NifB/NifX family molybdenum-iron cluster-binding protein [Sulfuricella sp.]|uniref:NifB/NifX family molybdenum-iron cluster-binding protein n=1 Tax=Sulfuricella sp. TaxID=2099377 RepID=UPI002C91BB68|nr:NifB/NifX family molybdenum-iron cluster-binding protein [Sulfuricella sp.]HUX64926.1 NifB/NifX family molybdenum-iron cluster-binding protein [Sulfuricella sp.]